ncbi:MAG: hypothetical protein QW575_07980 [Thermoproteota archaeon]
MRVEAKPENGDGEKRKFRKDPVVCPICGSEGTLKKKRVGNNYYYYIYHGKKKYCYIGAHEYIYVSKFHDFILKGMTSPVDRDLEYLSMILENLKNKKLSEKQMQRLSDIIYSFSVFLTDQFFRKIKEEDISGNGREGEE